MGDQITLNERNYNIKVVHNSNDETWTASWGTRTSQTAYSAATALRMLADEFDALGLHGSAAEKLRSYRRSPDTFCKSCHAPIFFGVLPSGKWLAFDTEPIAGVDDEERVATFPRQVRTTRGMSPSAMWHFGNSTKLPTYIPHPQTCGDNVLAPTSAPVKERWDHNRTVTQARVDRAIAGLRNIRAEINKGALDDPNEHEPRFSGLGNDGSEPGT